MKSVNWIPHTLTTEHLRALREAQNQQELSRICFHESTTSDLHIMLISCAASIQYPMHKHDNTDEWYLIIDGELTLHQLSDLNGEPKIITLSSESASIGSGQVIGHLVSKNLWHSTVAGHDGAIFLEVRRGPFAKESTIFPEGNAY